MEQLKSILDLSDKSKLFECFEAAAHELLLGWNIVSANGTYQILEIEFFCHSEKMEHLDIYTIKAPVQKTFGRWFFHNGGAELTIGNEDCYGSVQLRSVRCIENGLFFNGPQRVFREVFEDAGSAMEPSGGVRMVRSKREKDVPIVAVPRVGLNISEFSKEMDERIEFILRPYRFFRTDTNEFADKYVAYLFLDKISNVDIHLQKEDTIYSKYIKAYDLGYEMNDLESVWVEHSKLLRLAILMGIQQRRGDLIEPELSNDDSVDI